MNHRRKIVIVPPASGLFGASGSARSSHWQAMKLAHALAADSDTEVIVATSDDFSHGVTEEPNVRIEAIASSCNRRAVHALKSGGTMLKLVRRSSLAIALLIGHMRIRWVMKPDVLISFITATNIIALLASRRGTVIVCERNDFIRKKTPTIVRILALRMYRRASKVVCNHPGTARFFAQAVSVPESIFIPNFLTLHNPEDPLRTQKSSDRIVMVGRLSPEKNHEFVLRCLPPLVVDFPSLSIDVLGDGKEHDRLQDLAADLGIEERVFFHGHVRDVTGVVSRSDLLVIASEFEGLPNVCLEAMTLGTPCLISTSISSMHELFRDDEHFFGYRHSDQSDFVAQCARILHSRSKRSIVARNAQMAVKKLCSDASVTQEWREILS